MPYLGMGTDNPFPSTKDKTMDIQMIGRITQIEATIKELQGERDSLRAEAVTQGWARWEVSVTTRAPSLAWWKENRPTVWEKYAQKSSTRRFKLNA